MKKLLFFVVIFAFLFTALWADDVVLEKGNIRVVLHEYSGSISLYSKSAKTGKFVSIIDNSNYSVNSGFYVRIDEVERKLEQSYNIDIETDYTETGVVISYNIKKQASIEVTFTPFTSGLSQREDCIKVDVSIYNFTESTHNYGLKAIFDTILGEVSQNHFYTANISSIESETLFTSMKTDKYIASSNGYDSVGFLLGGSNVSEPQITLLANRDILLTSKWIPNVSEKRPFDSVSTVNNSALGIVWRDMELDSLSKSNITFFITTSTNKRMLPLEKNFPANMLAKNLSLEESSYIDSYGTTYIIGVYKKEQLDPEYIADLLNRIHNLEVNEDGSNKDEIKKLNAELDAIMLQIKKVNPEANVSN